MQTRLLRFLLMAGFACAILGLFTAVGSYIYFSHNLPKLDTLNDYKPALVTEIYSEDQQLIGEYFKEKRYIMQYNEIPPLVIQAFISSEDGAFFKHAGINFSRILVAAFENVKAGHAVQGGSTITQQVAKTLLLTSEKTLTRKIKEAILSTRIEKTFSKEQILFLYLNQIYLGHKAYGVEAASRNYFRKSVRELNLGEASMIAGLPQAPSRFDPSKNPESAKKRQAYVLNRMVAEGYITKDQAAEAYRMPLTIFRSKNVNLTEAPHYSEFIRRYLVQAYGEERVYSEGFKVHSACVFTKQKAAQSAVRDGLHALDQRQGYRGPITKLDEKDWSTIYRESKLDALRAAVPYRILEGKNLDAHQEEVEPVPLAETVTPESPAPESVAQNEEELETGADAVLINTLEQMWLSKLSESEKKNTVRFGKTPLVENTLYKGVVLKVDQKLAAVRVGDVTGIIKIENTAWARPPNPEMFHEWIPVSKLDSVLKRGDVIYVSVKVPLISIPEKEKEIIFYLDQKPVVEGALLSMAVDSGLIEAMVGGYDFTSSQFNRALQAMRQAGSTFKPFIYAAGLDKGLTPSTIIVDSPIIYRDEDAEFQRTWKPSNFGETYSGDRTMRDALINSMNIPTIKVVQEIGVSYVTQYARKMGISSPLNNDLSLALGSSSVYLHELVRAYALFANSGKRVHPVFIKRMIDRNGTEILNTTTTTRDPSVELLKHTGPINDLPLPSSDTQAQTILSTNPADPDQVLTPQTAYQMAHLMKGVVLEGTGAAARSLGVPLAGKTGTTNEYIDAWFMGYAPDVVTGVWTGFDEVRTLGRLETGGRAALPIWIDYMKTSLKDKTGKDFTIPEKIVITSIDSHTGRMATPKTTKKFDAAFKEGTLPGQEGFTPFVTSLKILSNATASKTGAINTAQPMIDGNETQETNTQEDPQEDFFRKELGP